MILALDESVRVNRNKLDLQSASLAWKKPVSGRFKEQQECDFTELDGWRDYMKRGRTRVEGEGFGSKGFPGQREG